MTANAIACALSETQASIKAVRPIEFTVFGFRLKEVRTNSSTEKFTKNPKKSLKTLGGEKVKNVPFVEKHRAHVAVLIVVVTDQDQSVVKQCVPERICETDVQLIALQ